MPPVSSTVEPRPAPSAPIAPVRRAYHRWVASETLEDYALRYTPLRFRRFSAARVANTAFGVASFLVLEAVGATLMLQFGVAHAVAAILAAGVIIALVGWPISVAAARHGVDMDLLTRGAGFGYLGSTLTSLIYATFTFIFFALEAAVMAYALELALGIPPSWGYLLCALVVIPLVTHGVTLIGRFQLWTQPPWLVLMLLPWAAVLVQDPGSVARWLHRDGAIEAAGGFDWHRFGAALTVALALVTQMGEQADYLRFMPPPHPARRWRWWAAVAVGGPGWVVPGVLKMLAGAWLAHLALEHGVDAAHAVDPNQMYRVAYEHLLPPAWAVAATALFVVVSQLKINVTNAYAGSLAWSNFFSRLTHHHPGRVVWMAFNIALAWLLMEMNVFQALGAVLGLYAHVALAWLVAVVADLVVLKPLGWSPRGLEFRRAHLVDVNPVGVGAMVGATLLGVAAHVGMLGALAQAFSALVSMGAAFVLAVLLGAWTRGRHHLARTPDPAVAGAPPGASVTPAVLRCVVCQGDYEGPDMARCPAYGGWICSLCCTLDARCGDACKPHARLGTQLRAWLRRWLPRRWQPYLDAGVAHYLVLLAVTALVLAGLLALLAQQDLRHAQALGAPAALIHEAYRKVYVVLLALAAGVVWWLVLAQRARHVAQRESNRYTRLLLREIDAHRRTDAQLQRAREQAEAARRAAERANEAKSRYLSAISHELRTPLGAIMLYVQALQRDAVPDARQAHALAMIQRAGEHVLSLVEGTLDLARIEAGRVTLDLRPTDLRALLEEVAALLAPQARAKGLRFALEGPPRWPAAVRTDAARLRQVLLNLLGNAVRYTDAGTVTLRVAWARELATIEVADTGPGMSASELERVFEPFARGAAASRAAGAGLGLTIARMLTELMGGELTVRSALGQGTTFRLRLYLPEVAAPAVAAAPAAGAAPAALPPPAAVPACPGLHAWPAPLRAALLERVRLGWARGVLRLLDEAPPLPGLEAVRQAARALDFDLLERWLMEASDDATARAGE
ncbi:Autoinducer 2 sensor kinase/phosphatase LuxQ [Tepidimonas sediminis]|uniref:histidine kinase n=1 Tax=Tepidimonas sediminis TaxID=2588941 RepID=A0A554WRL9_9BURK|nr:ATP-binding protein [Tepidimonas sediminis]TSE26218.1 Autoinducer 2 sensor kinase/phosphatase LuxQ [Tepidimonas sediminis]